MSCFAIDMGEEKSYSLAAPKGVSGNEIIDKKQLAISNWQLAGPTKTSPLINTDDTDRRRYPRG